MINGQLVAAVCALLLGAAPAAPSPPPPMLGIDLRLLDRPTFTRLEAAGIYQALVLRLVNENVALVDPRAEAEYTLRFETDARTGELRLSVEATGASRSAAIDIRALDQDAVRLQVVHTAVELVRQVQVLVPPRPPAGSAPPKLLVTRAELTAAGLWSAGNTGLMGRLGVGRRWGPVEVGGSLWLHRPLPQPSSLSLTEWGAFAAVGTGERAISQGLRVSAELEVGVLSQRFRYSGEDGRDSGARLDAAATLHGTASWRITRSWRAGLTAGVLVGRGRTHEDSSGRLYRTPALRPFLGLTAGFGLEN